MNSTCTSSFKRNQKNASKKHLLNAFGLPAFPPIPIAFHLHLWQKSSLWSFIFNENLIPSFYSIDKWMRDERKLNYFTCYYFLAFILLNMTFVVCRHRERRLLLLNKLKYRYSIHIFTVQLLQARIEIVKMLIFFISECEKLWIHKGYTI